MKQIKVGMILSSCQSLRQGNPFSLESWNILFGAALISQYSVTFSNLGCYTTTWVIVNNFYLIIVL